jgi:hypothetical protein
MLPSSVFPFLMGIAVWVLGGYLYIAPFIYGRITIPLVKEYSSQVFEYAQFHEKNIKQSEAHKYARCIYDEVYKNEEFNRDFTLWVSTFGKYQRDRLKDMKPLLDQAIKNKNCGDGYGTV